MDYKRRRFWPPFSAFLDQLSIQGPFFDELLRILPEDPGRLPSKRRAVHTILFASLSKSRKLHIPCDGPENVYAWLVRDDQDAGCRRPASKLKADLDQR